MVAATNEDDETKVQPGSSGQQQSDEVGEARSLASPSNGHCEVANEASSEKSSPSSAFKAIIRTTSSTSSDKPDDVARYPSLFSVTSAASGLSRRASETSKLSKSKTSKGYRVKHFFGVGVLEPRDLRFVELCAQRYPDKCWDDLKPKQQVELIRNGLAPQQLLLEPHSTYQKYWDMVVLLALTFTSIVTPYEVGFLETQYNFLFFLNRFFDCVFLKDMIMQFFLKLPVQTKQCTVWVKDRRSIAKMYLKGWFAIDVASILPFEVASMVLQDPAIQKLKVVRLVRLLRLLKLVRVLRASRIIKRWENNMSISYSMQGLIKFTTLLSVISHWMACCWGMLGLMMSENLECINSKEYILHTDPDGDSWMTARNWGPNSPCNPLDAYLAALHFSVMTITSIGYGDVTPTRNEELIVCILCQLSGGLVWAFVIGSICGIVSNANPVRIAFEQSMDALNAMLSEQGVSETLRRQLREYLREQQYHHFLLRARSISNHFSPALQGDLILETAIGKAIRNVWYFQSASVEVIVRISTDLEAQQMSPREEVCSIGALSIVQRGSVARTGRILLAGMYWGQDMILSSSWLMDVTPGIALSFVEVLKLWKEVVDRLMAEDPVLASAIRKAAAQIAFRNAVRIVARWRLEKKAEQEGSRVSTLMGASSSYRPQFNNVRKDQLDALFEPDANVKVDANLRASAMDDLKASGAVRPNGGNDLEVPPRSSIMAPSRRSVAQQEPAGFGMTRSKNVFKQIKRSGAGPEQENRPRPRASVAMRSSLEVDTPRLTPTEAAELEQTDSTCPSTRGTCSTYQSVATGCVAMEELTAVKSELSRLCALVEAQTLGLPTSSKASVCI